MNSGLDAMPLFFLDDLLSQGSKSLKKYLYNWFVLAFRSSFWSRTWCFGFTMSEGSVLNAGNGWVCLIAYMQSYFVWILHHIPKSKMESVLSWNLCTFSRQLSTVRFSLMLQWLASWQRLISFRYTMHDSPKSFLRKRLTRILRFSGMDWHPLDFVLYNQILRKFELLE